MTLAVGARLGPYEIQAPLGAGGMGEVYRARDTRLGRDVAIKVLPERLAQDPDALSRFEREAKAVAALSHPNILALHDFSREGSVAYAVMELLEGETLRGKLDTGPISPKQAIDYALQIARGLSAAHEKGVIHRDLKPENVFVVRGGHVKVLDFGLAKQLEPDTGGGRTGAAADSALTEPGIALGTAGYMSPEQVRGLPVDHRSDIFSFGAILYEMLSGHRAFQRNTAIETMTAILRDEPPDTPESGKRIPPSLDHIVRHCLEKEREERFQAVQDIAFALSEASSPAITVVHTEAPPSPRRRALLAAAGVAVLLGIAAILVLSRSHRSGDAAAGFTRVAVLPFENIGAPEDDYFADGIADEVRGKLTMLPGLQVIARGSSTPYRKTTKTPQEIARELGVRYLLTATVRWDKSAAENRVHVSPELVEVSGEQAPTSKWQQPFEAGLTNVFQVQSDIAARVAEQLGVVLQPNEEKQLAEKPTKDLAAYDAYLRGQQASKSMAVQDPPSLRRALTFYEQAVALDPEFAVAWAKVAWANSMLYGNSAPTPVLAEAARRAAERAVALAPNRPDGYIARGQYERLVAKDANRALEQFALAERLSPGNAEILAAIAVADVARGRWDAALENLQRAERLDPRSVSIQRRLGDAFFWLRRYSPAREAFDRGLALAPTHLGLIEAKAMTYLAEGDLPGGRAVLRAVPKEVDPAALVAYVAAYWDVVWLLDDTQRNLLVTLPPSAFDDDRATWGLCLAEAYALKGDGAQVRAHAMEAKNAIEEQLRSSPEDAQRRVGLGLALAYVGEKARAVEEAERGVAMLPVAKDGFTGPFLQHQLARIYVLVGEPAKAVDRLEPLLKIPYYLSARWLAIDPNFDPLRKNPRFERLVAGAR
ncbi:MAG TPA: protein kinase [Thermoanaerobaculia bacterium]|nr:protein kinase [Thermoanaerobaculia bacterium]